MRKKTVLGAAVLVVAGATVHLGLGPFAAGASTTTTVATPTTVTTSPPSPTSTVAPSPPGPPGAVCWRRAPLSSGTGPVVVAPEICRAWRPLDRWSGHSPSLYTVTFGSNRGQPPTTAYATWMRSATTDLALYPGYLGPGPTNLARGPECVPPGGRSRLLATFNAGFYESDVRAGFYVNHTLYYPMVDGEATVVRYTNGRVNVIDWGGGPRPGANIVMARQNLPLLVSGGVPTARAADNALWGLTLYGAPAVWRSALGVDARGNLIYVAADGQTSSSLAALLVQLHVVRAMELDINPEWPIFVSYGGAGAQNPSLIVPNPNQIPTRFLTISTKDFFALYLSSHSGEPQPW